ncbi:AMP-dependent synthetase and ligase [Chytriomyces cf. hyalinus JEL632]|nr:AMP-dependent synthetase and ligase [Chytriomyces cf. hyalinus JEL632]
MKQAQSRIAAIAEHLKPTPDTSDVDNANKVFRSELSPVSLLRRTCSLYPTRTAFVHGNNGGSAVSYSAFSERVRRLARALSTNFGVGEGDRVAVLVPNTPCILEANFAVPLCLAQIVSINTRLNQDEIDYILTLSQPKVLFVDHELEHLTVNFKKCGVAHRVVVADLFGTKTAANDPYEQLIAGADAAPWSSFPPLKSEDDVISINFTSGTTGRPKGVMYHHRGAYLNSLCLALEMGMTSESNFLWTLPMFHASGWCFPWAVCAVGATHTLIRKVDYDLIWHLFETANITHYCGAPTVQLSIVNHKSAHPLNRQIKTMVAAAPPSPTLLEGLLKIGITPFHVYGLTETYGPSTICAWQSEWRSLGYAEMAEKLSRQGQAFLASDEVQVWDEETGREVPADGTTLGEVVFRGNLVMKGYLNDEKATRESFKGGVFHTGDVGVKHPDGYIELRDRKKDIIISGGENISTIEIEQAIVSHPAVFETCVVSAPDNQWGERPIAYVTLKKEISSSQHAAFEQELLKYLRTKIAGYKMPIRVHILVELPKTSTGKIQKFVLRDQEWAKAGRVGGKKIN